MGRKVKIAITICMVVIFLLIVGILCKRTPKQEQLQNETKEETTQNTEEENIEEENAKEENAKEENAENTNTETDVNQSASTIDDIDDVYSS